MSCIKAVVEANDLILTRSHQEFRTWRKRQLETTKGKSKSLFRWALQHYNTSKRKITKICPTFTAPKTYARAIVTTFVQGNKLFWNNSSHPCWKQADREPPPKTRNGAPMRVLYTSERESQYKFVFA